MKATLSSQLFDFPGLSWKLFRRIGALGAILLLHIVFFYTLKNGLLHQATQVLLQKEVFVTLITPEHQADQPKPQPAAPKFVPALKQPSAPQPPTIPISNAPPSQPVIPTSTVGAATTPLPESVALPIAAAPSPAVPTQPKTISTGIEYIQPPQPEYPPMAKRLKEEDKVLLRILVNEKGHPAQIDIQHSSGLPRLDEAARQAAARAVFKPFIEDGKAVVAYALVPIKFQLDN